MNVHLYPTSKRRSKASLQNQNATSSTETMTESKMLSSCSNVDPTNILAFTTYTGRQIQFCMSNISKNTPYITPTLIFVNVCYCSNQLINVCYCSDQLIHVRSVIYPKLLRYNNGSKTFSEQKPLSRNTRWTNPCSPLFIIFSYRKNYSLCIHFTHLASRIRTATR